MIGWLLHWLAVHTGTVNEAGPYYGFWSGFGSDLSELAIVGGLVAVYRRHNCHQHWCWRVGRFPVGDGQFVTCRRHHPDPVIRDGVRAHHILAAHKAHERQQLARVTINKPR